MYSSAFLSVVHILCPMYGDFRIACVYIRRFLERKESTFEARYNTPVRLRIVGTVTTKTAPCAHTLIADSLLLERYIMPLGK